MAVELKVGIGADISDLSKGVAEAAKTVENFVSNVSNVKVPKINIPKVDTTSLKIADAEIDTFLNKIKKISDVGKEIQGFGKSMSTYVTLPILGLGAAAIKTYGDIEAMKKGLIAVMGSASAAESEFSKLLEVAKLPGLGLKEAAKGSVTLQAAGFTADRARQSLLAFGNALATVGKGGVELGMVNLALSQLQNKSSGFGQDLRQLTEQLPQLRGALQSAFGTIDTEAIGKMGVTGAQVVDKLITEFEKLPKVTGGINNAFENLRDAIFVNLGKVGEKIDKAFNISAIVDKLIGYLNSAVSAFENLSPGIQKAILVVAGLVAAAGPLLVVIGGIMAILPSVIAGFGAFSVALTALTGPIGLVVLGIGAIIAAVVGNWGKIKPYIDKTINNLIQLYNESKAVRVIVQSIGFAFQTAFESVGKILQGVWNSFKNFGKGILELFAGIGTAIKGALTGDLDQVGAGLKRGFRAITSTSLGFVNVFKGTVSEIGRIFDENEKKWSSMGKRSPIKLGDVSVDGAKDLEDKIVNKVGGAVKKAKAKDIKIELPGIEPIVQGKAKGLSNGLGDYFDTALDYENWFNGISVGLDSLNAKVPLKLSELQISMQSGILSVMEGLKPLADFGNFFANSLDLAFDTVVNTITDSFSAIGEAMASGGNVIGAFGQAILGGIGSFLGDLGKQMVQYGVAALAMSVLSKLLLNPITAAPAAIAMIAAGAALSLASGAIKGVLKGGSSSGGSAPTSGGTGSQSYSSSFSGGGNGSGEVVFRISGNDLVGVLSRQQDKNSRIGG